MDENRQARHGHRGSAAVPSRRLPENQGSGCPQTLIQDDGADINDREGLLQTRQHYSPEPCEVPKLPEIREGLWVQDAD